MKIILTGGGTGGHITPLLAVAHKLKAIDPSIEIIYVGDRGTKFASMTEGQTVFDKQYRVFAGKFRRYNGESWLKRLLDVKTNLLNLRDFFLFMMGTVESWFLLHKLKPDVILLKGGFVGVPVGLAARKRIPIVTHDSDALPGLANRLVGRWAVYHATGMPAEYYNYPVDETRYVGVIVGEQYQSVDQNLLAKYRSELKIPLDAQVLLVTGGSNGAQSVNAAIVAMAPRLLERLPNLYILHQVGRGNEKAYGSYKNDRLVVQGLVANLHIYSGAADAIVTRAGANTIAEFGVQGKACIVVPNPLLTGGHQLKNAQYLVEQNAAVVVDEQGIAGAVDLLLTSAAKRTDLGRQLQAITVKDAAQKLAELLIDISKRAGE